MATATKPAKGKPAGKEPEERGRKSTLSKRVCVTLISSLDGFGEWIAVADFAELIKTNPQTIRAWERKRLLPEACFPPESDDRRLYFRTRDLQAALRRALPKTS